MLQLPQSMEQDGKHSPPVVVGLYSPSEGRGMTRSALTAPIGSWTTAHGPPQKVDPDGT